MNIQLIEQMIEEKYITKRPHPTDDLFILNYSHTAAIDRKWNEATMMCRGLIVDGDWNIVARPFKKFFSFDQWQSLRNDVHHMLGMKYRDMFKGDYDVYEKADGSLGILYTSNGSLAIATRGSFESDQAKKGTEILHRYLDNNPEIGRQLMENSEIGFTYMFEIIYPENRIVIDYKGQEQLILLGAVDNDTGKEYGPEMLCCYDIADSEVFPVVKNYKDATIADLSDLETPNAEGFVVRFKNGVSSKFKFDEYMRLHRIMTEITPLRIWDILRTNIDLDTHLKGVPDEFYDEIKTVASKFESQFEFVENGLIEEWKRNKDLSRKEIGLDSHIPQFVKAYIFARMDGKSYADSIWRKLRPVNE
jgi:RNA ligase